MSKILKITLILALVALLLPTIPVSSKPSRPTATSRTPTKTLVPSATRTPTSTRTPTPTLTKTFTPTPLPLTLPVNWSVPAIPGNCSLGRDPIGSQTLICVPNTGWQLFATVIIFAHGYVNPYFPPKEIPWDQMSFKDTSGATLYLSDMVTNMGYYFATTSYRANGLVVQDAIQDLLNVRSMALSRMNALFKTVVLAGVSEGGLITALSIERNPSSYYAGLAMCGPYGDFQKQIDYWGNFRTLYDVYYPYNNATTPPQGLAPDAVNTPRDTIIQWYGPNQYDSLYRADTASRVLADRPRTLELLANTNAPYDVGTANETQSIQDTVLGLLDYNVFATENGKQVLGGNPFSNIGKVYPSSSIPGNLNTLVTRYAVSGTALANIPKYETTGVLTKPLVVMHTTGDPIVPFGHVDQYQAKVASKGYSANFSRNDVSRYGHCNFTEGEIMAAFDMLNNRATGMDAPDRSDLLSGQELEKFNRMMKEDQERK